MPRVKLFSFQCRKLINERLIDHELLVTVLARGFVLMLADTLPKECRHLKVWVTQQGGDTDDRGDLLGEERTTAIAQQQVGMLLIDQCPDMDDRLRRAQRQIRGQDAGLTIKGFS